MIHLLIYDWLRFRNSCISGTERSQSDCLSQMYTNDEITIPMSLKVLCGLAADMDLLLRHDSRNKGMKHS